LPRSWGRLAQGPLVVDYLRTARWRSQQDRPFAEPMFYQVEQFYAEATDWTKHH
jgi:hypothetical protein